MKPQSTIIALVAALAVTTGGLGLTFTGVFDEAPSKVASQNYASGFMMGHLQIETFDKDGNLKDYRQTDNAVVDDGEQCISKMLFGTTQASAGRGEYTGTSACTGALTGAWDVIAIGTTNTDNAGNAGVNDTDVILGNETATSKGLERGTATTKTWTNGTGQTTTKIVMSKTFTSDSPRDHTIVESGLFNSTTVAGSGMLARQTFSGVTLSDGDSITVTWTFTVGD